MKKKKNNILLEDVAYGIYDRPGPTGKVADADEDVETTVPPEVPVLPTSQMSNQLSVQRPPIEDEDYMPSSTEELSRAASAIAQLTPNDSIEFFYKRLHDLLDDATDHSAEKRSKELDGEPQLDQEKKELAVTEESLRRHLRRMLLEELTDDDMRDYDEFRSGGYSVVEPEIEEDQSSGDLSLDDMAQMFGYAGAPGMRQEIERLTDRLTYFATKVKEEDLNALTDYAAGEFIDAMEEGEYIDPEDVKDLRAAPKYVTELDSFRYFFVSAFIMPSYRKVVRDATKKVKSEISQLGIPKELHQTVFNQITGAAARKPAVIIKKLQALAKSGKIKDEEVKELASKIESSRAALVAASDYSDDFVQNALDKWQKTGKAGRLKALKQSLETTLSEA